MFLGIENVVKHKVTRDEWDKLKEKSADILPEFIRAQQCHLHLTHPSDLCFRCTARNSAQAAPDLVEGIQPGGAPPGSAQPGGVQPRHTQGTFWRNI